MNTSSNNNNIESKNQVYVTVCNGIAQDIFIDREKAVKDLRRHVYDTLVHCCGGKVEGDGETCYVVSYPDKSSNDICMIVPFNPDNREHREAYNAQRSLYGLPELQAITEAEGIKVGDHVKHNWTGDQVATVTGIRRAYWDAQDGEVWLFRLDYGKQTTGEFKSVLGPFKMEMNGGEYRREALTPCTADYYSEYQKLDHQEARPQKWLKEATSEERETYYRACVELERMAGDGLPLVIRADSADLTVNPWHELGKRVKTARVFHLGDRVKTMFGLREVTGIVDGIRCNECSLSLGGWCTHYNIRWDEQYQYTTGYGTTTGCGNISPESIELIERAEFCPEPASEWLRPGEKVAHYLDYGDGTGDWLTGCVTGYDLDDDDKGVTVIYGKYRTPLKDIVKYQPEMDNKAA